MSARSRRTRDLLTVLTRSDIRVRYGRGRLRVLKWVADPIAALGIYLLLVALVLDQGSSATGLSLACAIVPFQLLLATVINATSAVNLRASIILNMRFPRVLIPISAVVTESVAFLATLVILPVMMVVYGVEPTVAVLWLPVAIGLTAVLALALSYPSTLFGIWYPDLQPFVVSTARAAFFLAPGLIALDQVSGTARDLLPLNPLTGLFESYRDALLYGTTPAVWELLAPLFAAVLIVAISLPVYMREQAELAKLVGMIARLEDVGIRFDFDHLGRVVTPGLAHLRRIKASAWGLRHVDLQLEPGAGLALVGPTGSGKTTLLRVLADVMPPDEGECEVRGRVGSLLATDAGLASQLTGRENAELLGVLAGLSLADTRAGMAEVAERAHLGDAFDRPVHTYSQGMRARLGLSVIQAISPDVLLLDEVFEALDHEFRAVVEQLARGVRDEGGVVVAAGHDHTALALVCPRAAWLEDGRIRAQGPFDEVVGAYRAA